MFRFVRAMLVPAAVLSLLGLLGTGCDVSTEGAGRANTPGAPPATKPPTAFKARSLSGKQLRFPGGYGGKVVLVDFWATWCPPCRAEIPHLRQAYQKYGGKKFEIVGVSLDQARGVSASSVRAFAEKNGMKWELLYEGADQIAANYGVEYIPAPFLLDGDTGKILARGDALKGAALLKTLERHVGGKTP